MSTSDGFPAQVKEIWRPASGAGLPLLTAGKRRRSTGQCILRGEWPEKERETATGVKGKETHSTPLGTNPRFETDLRKPL